MLIEYKNSKDKNIMKGNMSILDGVLRLFAGILLGAIAGVLSYWIGAWAIIFVPFSLILLATAMSGDCPLYHVLGICTAEQEPEKEVTHAPIHKMAA
jgi:hypothetical protein